MGICVALNCDALASHEQLFLKEGVKEAVVSTRHCEQLVTIITKHKSEVLMQMRLQVNRFNPHGLRKGSATHAVSGTMHTPSLPSTARRGEWSQGLILDVCCHFAATGDHCVGWIFACLLLQCPKLGIQQSVLTRDSFIRDSFTEDTLLWLLLLALSLTSSEEHCSEEQRTIVRDAGLGCMS